MAVEITSREELKEWLKDKPREWAQVIALRSALRVAPIACDPANWKYGEVRPSLTKAMFRAMAVSSAAAEYPADDTVRRAARAAAAAADAAAASASAAVRAANVARAAYAASAAVRAANVARAVYAASAAAAAASATDAPAAFWQQVSQECTQLEDGTPHETLLGQPLWAEPFEEERPDWFQDAWGRAAQWLSRPEDGFEIWREWYYGRLEGLPRAFKGFDEPADRHFYLWLIAQEDKWWNRKPAQVNADVKAEVDRLRKPEPDEATLVATPDPGDNAGAFDDEGDDTRGNFKVVATLKQTSSPKFAWDGASTCLETNNTFTR